MSGLGRWRAFCLCDLAQAGELHNADGSLRHDNTALEFTSGMYARGLAPKRLVNSPDPDIRRLCASLFSPS